MFPRVWASQRAPLSARKTNPRNLMLLPRCRLSCTLRCGHFPLHHHHHHDPCLHIPPRMHAYCGCEVSCSMAMVSFLLLITMRPCVLYQDGIPPSARKERVITGVADVTEEPSIQDVVSAENDGPGAEVDLTAAEAAEDSREEGECDAAGSGEDAETLAVGLQELTVKDGLSALIEDSVQVRWAPHPGLVCILLV